MKQISLLHVIAAMDPQKGGVCEAVRIIITGLKKQGMYSEVVSLDPQDAPYLSLYSFPIHALGPGKSPWCYSKKLTSWLRENLERFDVAIIHGLWLYPSYAARRVIYLFRKKKKKTPKFFVMPHGMLDPYFQQASGRRVKAIRNWIFWKIIEHKIINQADGLLFTCETEKLLARKTFTPYQPQKEFVIGLGIEAPPTFAGVMTEAFQNKMFSISEDPYWLYFSRIHEKKGIDLLIKAYLDLKKRTTSKIPRLIIAGPGLETDYGRRIRQLAAESEDIHFTGMLTGNAKWGAFYGCQVFILPSHQENFGIAIVEAMACGKPVLISDKVNIWREIKKGGGGCVAANKEEEIRGMLEYWHDLSYEEQQNMGQLAKISFENYFATGPACSRLINAMTN